MEPNIDNVLRVFRLASPAQYVEGASWYPSAYSLCRELDNRDPRRPAGILAAFSPQTPWWRNVKLTMDIFETGIATGHTSSQCAKAQAIFNGANPMDVLGGKKTLNFYQNIIDPWNPEPITIDAHAIDIAIGKKCVAKTRPKLSRKGEYERYAEVYRTAALLFNLRPNVMQAITWVTWREDYAKLANA